MRQNYLSTALASCIRPQLQRTFLVVALSLVMHDKSVIWAADVELVRSGDVVTVQVDGRLFARYLTESGTKPVVWPIIGPTGQEVTRAFPMRTDSAVDTTDHPHHRSLWFGHGDVNGNNFWIEEKNAGKIKHLEFVTVESQPVPLLITRNEWIDEEQNRVLSDMRALRFYDDGAQRWIDFDITLINDTKDPVTFGDTKEGSFAIRVADSMRVEVGKGGRIVNAVEATNDEAWGKTAAWVDYQGPLGELNGLGGIAVLNHPNSFRFPTYWHVRTYGLMAANCFGLHNFRNSRDEDGSHVLPPGESISFFFRVVLHRGDEKQAEIPKGFIEYAKINKQPVVDQVAERLAEDPSPSNDVPEVVEQDQATQTVGAPTGP